MEWRDIAGYEGLYRINHLGEVMSLPRNGRPGRFLKPQKSLGYLSIGLSKNKIVKTFKIHILVAKAFIGPYPEGKEVNHIDGKRDNPRSWNLEYVTHAENAIHSSRILGNLHGNRTVGISRWQARFTEKQILEIRGLSGVISQRNIERKFDCSRGAIRHIIKRRSWKHI